MKERLRKRGLDIGQARRMVQDKCDKVCAGECMGHSQGDEPLTLTRFHCCGLPQLYEALEGWKSVYARAYNLKGIKGKFSVFFSFTLAHFMAWCVPTPRCWGGGDV